MQTQNNELSLFVKLPPTLVILRRCGNSCYPCLRQWQNVNSVRVNVTCWRGAEVI